VKTKYLTKQWGAGHQYDSAFSQLTDFIESMQNKYGSFKVVSVSMENTRPSWQSISLVYSIDQNEVELLDLKQQYKDTLKQVAYFEGIFIRLNEKYYSKEISKELYDMIIYGEKLEDTTPKEATK